MAVLEPPMLTQEQTVEVKVLSRQGRSLRAIARETGLSRVTVRRTVYGRGRQPHAVHVPARGVGVLRRRAGAHPVR